MPWDAIVSEPRQQDGSSSSAVQPAARPGAPAARRLLMVGNFLSASIGTTSVGEELAGHLRSVGWEVFCTSSRLPRMSRLVDMVATVYRLRTRYALAQVDVYSGAAFIWAEAACLSLRMLRKPFVLTLHGGGVPDFARRWPRRVRRLLGAAAAVTAPSAYLLEAMRPHRADVLHLPNPIDLSAYRFRPRDEIRPKLLWLRAFHDIYNPTLAPRVVKLLEGRYPDLQLDMVGPDKGDGSFQRTVELTHRLGLEDRVRFPGGVSKEMVPAWMADADVFINTTNVDNTPVTLLEAMATGLCIVSTDVGGVPFLVAAGEEALLVPANDEAAMAASIDRLLQERGLAGRLSRRGRARAERHDWSAVLPRWDELLTGLLRRQS
jgi:L-malate glycosyltransferase